MAHNIEVRKVNGVEIASFAESTENGTQRAWHSLGQIKRERMTVVDALKESHSDYTVTKQPIAALAMRLWRLSIMVSLSMLQC